MPARATSVKSNKDIASSLLGEVIEADLTGGCVRLTYASGWVAYITASPVFCDAAEIEVEVVKEEPWEIQ